MTPEETLPDQLVRTRSKLSCSHLFSLDLTLLKMFSLDVTLLKMVRLPLKLNLLQLLSTSILCQKIVLQLNLQLPTFFSPNLRQLPTTFSLNLRSTFFSLKINLPSTFCLKLNLVVRFSLNLLRSTFNIKLNLDRH